MNGNDTFTVYVHSDGRADCPKCSQVLTWEHDPHYDDTTAWCQAPSCGWSSYDAPTKFADLDK